MSSYIRLEEHRHFSRQSPPSVMMTMPRYMRGQLAKDAIVVLVTVSIGSCCALAAGH